ncbi:hypothetical protein GHO36_19490 [Pseudomonas sp. FSL R10-2398]|nr:hypothetical protein [Pseudomonas sp. FSL R10-2398]
MYLKKPGQVISTYEQLEKLLLKNKYLQPRLAEFERGAWAVKEPLLQKPIWHYVLKSLPGLTPDSAQVVAKRLFMLSDSSTWLLTQTRMRTLTETLYGWFTGHLTHGSGALRDPLALLTPALGIRPKTLLVRTRASPTWFDRIDFSLKAGDLLKLSTATGLNEVMRSLLQRLGYTIYADIPGVSELVFRRSGMQTINFMQLHRAVGAELALVIELEDAVTLMINKNPLSPLSLALTNARAEGKLLTFVGGVQNTPPYGLTQGFICRT